MSTRTDMINRIYRLLGEASDSDEYDEENVVIPKLDDVVSRITNGQVVDIRTVGTGNDRIYRAGDLKFMRDNTFYTSVEPVELSSDANVGDTSLTLSCGDFLSTNPSYVYVNGDVIRYTGKTGSTALSGVTGIDTTHKAGDIVYQVYPFPVDLSKPYTLYEVISSNNLRKVEILDVTKPVTYAKYATILRDNDNSIDLLHIVGYAGDTKFLLHYYMENVTMDDGTDVCVIPDPYAMEVVCPIVAGELLYENEEVEDANTKLNKGYGALVEMYGFYAKQTKDTDKRIQSGNPITINNLLAGDRYGWSRGRRIG